MKDFQQYLSSSKAFLTYFQNFLWLSYIVVLCMCMYLYIYIYVIFKQFDDYKKISTTIKNTLKERN